MPARDPASVISAQRPGLQKSGSYSGVCTPGRATPRPPYHRDRHHGRQSRDPRDVECPDSARRLKRLLLTPCRRRNDDRTHRSTHLRPVSLSVGGSLTEQGLTGYHPRPLRWLVPKGSLPPEGRGRRGRNVQARAGRSLEVAGRSPKVMRGSTASVRDGDDQLAPHVPLAAERERRGQFLERQDVGHRDTQLPGVGHPT